MILSAPLILLRIRHFVTLARPRMATAAGLSSVVRLVLTVTRLLNWRRLISLLALLKLAHGTRVRICLLSKIGSVCYRKRVLLRALCAKLLIAARNRRMSGARVRVGLVAVLSRGSWRLMSPKLLRSVLRIIRLLTRRLVLITAVASKLLMFVLLLSVKRVTVRPLVIARSRRRPLITRITWIPLTVIRRLASLVNSVFLILRCGRLFMLSLILRLNLLWIVVAMRHGVLLITILIVTVDLVARNSFRQVFLDGSSCKVNVWRIARR